jgi:hypothetical protein
MGPKANSIPWWLDVETANSWSNDTTVNTADLEGSVAFLKSTGVSSIGIYSGARHWSAIVGANSPTSSVNAPFAGLFNWVWMETNVDDPAGNCADSFSGGRVKYVQFPANGYDGDFVCPQ